MMRRLMFAALVCLMVHGCSVVDEGDMDRLVNKVSSIPIEMRHVMAKWAANRIAYGFLLSYAGDVQFGQILCEDPADSSKKETLVEVKMHEMWHCLTSHLTSTYFDCLDIILDDTRDQYPDDLCQWHKFQMNCGPKEVPQDFKAERVSDRDIVQVLLGPLAPPPEIQAILIGVGGFMGPSGVLCPMTEWGCPPRPDGTVPDPDESTSTGGDW